MYVQLKTITVSSTFFSFRRDDWYFGLGRSPFQEHCPQHQHRECLTTRDLGYVDQFGKFDAVLMNTEALRCPGLSAKYLNKGRSQTQRYEGLQNIT